MYRTTDRSVVAHHAGRIRSAFPGVAFHPTRPLLVAPSAFAGQLTIWEVDVDRLVARAAPDEERDATARIALVGDAGVGKTGLGWRLAHGSFKVHSSTHGQQHWPLDALRVRSERGRRRGLQLRP